MRLGNRLYDRRGVLQLPAGARDYLFSRMSRPSPLCSVLGALPSEIKRPWRAPDHSPSSSTKAKLYLHSPTRLHGVHMDKFTIYTYFYKTRERQRFLFRAEKSVHKIRLKANTVINAFLKKINILRRRYIITGQKVQHPPTPRPLRLWLAIYDQLR